MSIRKSRLWSLAVVATLLVPASCVWGAKPSANDARAEEVDARQVGLFEAIDAGEIDVKFIPQSSKGGNVVIENKTNQPLTIKLPDAFAGVPVLAQIGGIGGGLGGLGGGGLGGGGLGGGGGQGLGGGFGGGLGGGGLGGGGFGGGGGVFNIGPEKVGKVKVVTVCLEHGKDEPNPRMKYELRPIESFTDNAEVVALCKLVGSGRVDQQSAQAAAWHLANGMSWRELAEKIGKKHLNGAVEPYFNSAQLSFAVRLVAEARQLAQSQPKSPGEKQDSPGNAATRSE